MIITTLLIATSVFAATDRTYSDVKVFLQNLAKNHPDTTQVFKLGDSDSGESILGVKIEQKDRNLRGSKINNLVVGTHHGNEYGSTEVALGFAASVAEKPIQDQVLYVIPVLNISGYDSRNRYEKSSAGGYFDANRDYPGPCVKNPVRFNLKSTKALAQFIEAKHIVASATLHTYSPYVLYPWGISTKDLKTEYDDLFKDIVKAAAQYSGYETGNSTDLLYPADGTFEDYAFWHNGVWSILFELGYSHSPNEEAVNEAVKKNVPGLRAMFEMTPREPAPHHDFTGKCDNSMKRFDRHDE